MRGKLKCPRCGSENVVSYGKSAKGRARMMCKACGRTFSRTAGTVMFSQKLRAIEGSVGATPSTAHLWRMKVYTAAKKTRDGAVLSGVVWIDEKLIPVNGGLIWRRPDGKKPRGASRNQIAVDAAGNRCAEVAGKGHISSLQCLKTCGKHIAPGSAIVHDGIFSHDALVAFLGGASEVHKPTTGEAHAKLQKVNSFIAEIERFVTVHPGLKSDYLDLYVAWVAFKASLEEGKIGEKVAELLQICEETPAEFYRKSRRHRN